MHAFTDGTIIGPQAVGHHMGHGVAGTNADADLEERLPLFVAGGAEDVLGSQTGAQGMVLLGAGGAEGRQETVAQHLRHRACKARHRLRHAIQNGEEQVVRIFRIAAGHDGGGADDVDEHCRYHLALARLVAWQA